MVSEIKQLSPVLFFLGAWESLQEWQQGKSHSPMEWKSVAVSRGVPPQKSEFVGLFSKLWGCSHPSAPGSLSKLLLMDLELGFATRGQGQRGDSHNCHQTWKSRGATSVPAMDPFGTGSPAALPCPCHREKTWNMFHSLFKGKKGVFV